VTLVQVLSNIVFARRLKSTSFNDTGVFGLTDSMSGKDMAVEVCAKPKGEMALVARIGL
jgi:hypothetical protein